MTEREGDGRDAAKDTRTTTLWESSVKPGLATCALTLALSAMQPLLAAAAEPAPPPGVGTILQQAQPARPAAPPMGAGLTIEADGGGALPPSAPFTVARIEISGNTVFDTATLHALVADAEGRSLTLVQFGAIVARVTNYYHQHDFPLARAIVPAQSIQGGMVRVQVIEARYGAIELDNRSRAADGLLESTLSPLKAGQPVNQRALDHVLLLASDVPGVGVTATLKPGNAVGTSDLGVQAGAAAPMMANLALDNDGDRYTGRTRFGANVDFIDPLRHGDVFSLGLLTSGSGMNYGSLRYEGVVNGSGTRLGASVSGLHYTLGDGLDALAVHGYAEVGSLWVKQPLLRTLDTNAYGELRFDRKQLNDEIDASQLKTKRHLDNFGASLNGDWRDGAQAGGSGAWSFGLTAGKVGFDNAEAQIADAAVAKTQGTFLKWDGSVSHLLSVSPGDQLYLVLSGQWSNSNLDPAEKMVAGGPYSVRGYDVDAISGDTGAMANAEWRHRLGFAAYGQWQVVGFLDVQRITVNKDPYQAGVNGATLSGGGAGLNWAGPQQWAAKLYVAAPIGSTPVLIRDTNSAHVWAEVDKAF